MNHDQPDDDPPHHSPRPGPDGRGVVYEGRTVEPGENIPIDDSACLWLTKRLRG